MPFLPFILLRDEITVIVFFLLSSKQYPQGPQCGSSRYTHIEETPTTTTTSLLLLLLVHLIPLKEVVKVKRAKKKKKKKRGWKLFPALLFSFSAPNGIHPLSRKAHRIKKYNTQRLASAYIAVAIYTAPDVKYI
jgi:hypothetical protein